MKNRLLKAYAFCFLLCCGTSLFAREFAVSVVVTDQDGTAVEGAAVKASFVFFGSSSKSVRVEGRSDSGGYVTLRAKGETQVSIFVKKEGYYPSAKPVNLYESDENGYSKPKNPHVDIVLKKIKNPIPMIARGDDVQLLLPVLNEPVGYDLFVDDWVVPYGEGKISDLLFQYSGKVDRTEVDANLFVSMGNGGFSRFSMNDDGSVLKSGYRAPPDPSEYEDRLVHRIKRSVVDEVLLSESTYQEGVGYYLLLRPVYDSDGNLKEAYYGKLYDDIRFQPTINGKCAVKFSAFYVNPIKNDTNVEFDPKRNLLQSSAENSPDRI